MNIFKNHQTLGFIFPGQGSQSVGMLAELAQAFPLVEETFATASEVLAYDLWQLVQQGPAEELDRTDRTQPAMLAAGVAVWRLWNEKGGAMPCLMAGHSLGEYTALVCAGALNFADAIHLVTERGRFMQEAVPSGEGAMAAVLGLSDETVQIICREVGGDQVLAAVNFNSPGQVVIAGHTAAVERAIEAAKAAGSKRAIKLPVSVPSHCRLMEPAARRMAKLLETVDIRPPQIPVINNVDVKVEEDPQRIRDALLRQLDSPVRWVEIIQTMAAQGISTVVEAGPGKVLTGLNRRIVRDMKALPVHDTATLELALASE